MVGVPRCGADATSVGPFRATRPSGPLIFEHTGAHVKNVARLASKLDPFVQPMAHDPHRTELVTQDGHPLAIGGRHFGVY